jgi:serine/threonine protein kinase
VAHDGTTRVPDSDSSLATTSLLSAPGPPVPARIGRYRIERLLGQGGQGAVYLGRHRYLGVEAAIKVLLVPMSQPRRQAFLREARRLVSLRGHPGIVEVREFGLYRPAPDEPPVPFLATDLVAGGRPLTRFAQFAKLDLAARLALFARVCDAVGHAHAMGIIHLDLKPGNILVLPGEDGKPPQPKVIDFGLARAADPAEELGHPAPEGTLPYMSPEQATPGTPLDPRSDVYSLGVILYELVTGSRPYAMPEDHAGALRVVQDAEPEMDTPAAAALPGPVRHIIERAMAKAPAERYADAGALCEDFRAYLAGLAPPGLKEGFWRRLRLRVGGFCARRPRTAAIAAVVLSTLLTVYVAVRLLHSTRVSAWFDRELVIPATSGDQLREVVLVTRLDESDSAFVGPHGARLPPPVVYANLMKALARAKTPPRAVAFDFYFDGISEEHAAAFAEGARALPCPVIVGTRYGDVDQYGVPLDQVLSRTVASAVAAWGDLGIYPGTSLVPWSIALIHQWSDGVADPALAFAMLAAVRRAEQHLDGYQIRYVLEGDCAIAKFEPRAALPAAQPPRSPHLDPTIWTPETKSMPSSMNPPRRLNYPNDDPRAALITLPMASAEFFRRSTLSLQAVVADPELCKNKVVLVYDALKPQDTVEYLTGPRLSGAFGHAMAFEALLSNRVTRRPGLLGEWLLPVAGAAAGLLLALPIVGRRSWWPRWARWGMVGLRGLLLIAGVAAGVVAAWSFNYLFNPLVVVFAMLATALLMVGADRLRRQYPALLESRS